MGLPRIPARRGHTHTGAGLGGVTLALDELSDVDLTGTANNDMLFRSAGSWIDTAGRLTWDGSNLKIWDATLADNLNITHDGTNITLSTTTTSLYKFDTTGMAGMTLGDGGDPDVYFDNTNSRVSINNGWGFRIYDATDTDYFELIESGTNCQFNSNNNSFIFNPASTLCFGITTAGNSSIGPWFRVYSAAVTGNGQFSWDGTDFNIALTSCTDLNFTGATGAYRFNASGTETFQIQPTLVNVAAGAALRIYDSLNTDYQTSSHDGTNFNNDYVNTTTAKWGENSGGNVNFAWYDGSSLAFWLRYTDNRVEVRHGYAFRVLDSLNGDYMDFSHDGTTFNMAATNTAAVVATNWGRLDLRDACALRVYETDDTTWFSVTHDSNSTNFGVAGTGVAHTFFLSDGTYSQVDVTGPTNFRVRDGAFIQAFDSTDTDYIRISHNGTSSNIDHSGTTDMRINSANLRIRGGSFLINTTNNAVASLTVTPASAAAGTTTFTTTGPTNWTGGVFNIRAGNSFRVLDSTNTDYLQIAHDGTDANVSAVTTTDINFTGVTGGYLFDTYLGITDGITAPATVTGFAVIYVDTADGDLKVKFGDGTVKTIVTDT